MRILIAVAFFFLLAIAGSAFFGMEWNASPQNEAYLKAKAANGIRWQAGMEAWSVNFVGCISSLGVVYWLRRTNAVPTVELVGAMAFRSGIPLVFMLLVSVGPWQTQSREYTLLATVIVYLLALPLDIWLIRPCPKMVEKDEEKNKV